MQLWSKRFAVEVLMSPKIKDKALCESARVPVQLDLFESDGEPPGEGSADVPEDLFELTPVSDCEEMAARWGRHQVETLEHARDLYKKGASYKTVAASLHISVYTARDWMHQYRNGTFDSLLQPGRAPASRYDESVKNRVLRLRLQEGLSYNKIVEATGISRATIRKWLSNVADGASQAEEKNSKDADGLDKSSAAGDTLDL